MNDQSFQIRNQLYQLSTLKYVGLIDIKSCQKMIDRLENIKIKLHTSAKNLTLTDQSDDFSTAIIACVNRR